MTQRNRVIFLAPRPLGDMSVKTLRVTPRPC